MNNMAGGWSSAGCVYDGQVNGRDVCLCDHLTNFAVLVDYYGQDDRVDRVHEVSLSIISLIGLSLSILGLSLTIISFVFFRKLRKGRAQQTLFNLALSMLCSWVIFLIGIKQTYHFIGCLIVAILLHYQLYLS
uniref:Latrophilin-like protein LAT-2 n=1 Tax=Crassostrea virginica TaxID=6565 RepID=A0A8B8BCV6_CRAVI|nr:latrophilin-like protein LAT-2 [Crassostrea virginica]